MDPEARFSLERHEGPYDTWPSRSLLLDRGRPTRTRVPGYVLRHQYAVPGGFLLVTDDDCPFEEMTHFVLVDESLRIRSARWAGWPYESFLLGRFVRLGDREFLAEFGERCHLVVRVAGRGIPYPWPRLQFRWDPKSVGPI